MGMKILVLFLLYSLPLMSFTLAETETQLCYDTGNFTEDGAYGINRDTILSSLSSSTSENDGFYTTTVGENPNKVHVLALCREDYSMENCSKCVNSTSQDLITKCPNQKEAISWDPCIVHYANRPFFGVYELVPSISLNNEKVSDHNMTENDFGWLWVDLMIGISKKTEASKLKFATGEKQVTSSQTIYALMQCTPDISQDDCHYCLGQSLITFQKCCLGKQGGYTMTPSCIFRWDFSPFYAPSLSSTTKEKSKLKWIPIAASSSTVFGLIVLGSVSFIIWRRRNNSNYKENSQEVQLLEFGGVNFGNNEEVHGQKVGGSEKFPALQFDIINTATERFCAANKLGEGGFGPVYKGILVDGKEIAVKRLSGTSGQGLVEFKNEVTLIARLQHRNLVRLLGCCLEGDEKLLVYEYMPNRSLDVFLFDAELSMQLDWKRRFNIINGIARGILYLHEDSRLRIIHRDLKASNILLDGEMNPKISDFGMARIFGANQSEANTNRVVGTYGYMAPEYAMAGLFSVKSDVFSFGVLLLEIISGKKNNNFYFHERGESLLTSAWKLWSEGQGMDLIDPLLVQSCVESQVHKCIHLGLLCVQKDPANRPTMSSLIAMLVSDIIALPKPAEPAFFIGRVPPADNINCSVNELTFSDISPR